MSELMLINPRRKKRRKTLTKRRDQRIVNPMAANPKRRRGKTRKAKSLTARTMSSVRHSFRRRSRKTARGAGRFTVRGFTTNTLMPSAVGAMGALGLDMLIGIVPLPAIVKTGAIRPFVKIAGAVGIGALAGMLVNKRVGEQVAAGAVTVVLYDVIKGFVQRSMPALQLGDVNSGYPNLEYVSPGYQVGEYVASDIVQPMGEYVEY